VHANAIKFWGAPYPEFWELYKIFGLSLATGEASLFLSQQLLFPLQQTNEVTPGEANATPDEDQQVQPTPNQQTQHTPTQQTQPTPSPTAYLSRSHSSLARKDSVATAINGLVT
jgi:hypothetical protein